MYKALIISFISAILLGGGALLVPEQTETLGAQNPISYTKDMYPTHDSTYYIGTTTRAYLGGNFDEICLAGDCETAWSAGSYPDYLSQVGDVSTTTLATGYVLKWSGSEWESVATSTLGITADSIAWGNVIGTLSDQTDLQSALDDKVGTTTALADTWVTYGTGAGTIGAESAFTYDDATDKLTVVNASTTYTSATKLFGGLETLGADIDLGATGDIILDDDGDTSINGDVDDVINFKLGGSDLFKLTGATPFDSGLFDVYGVYSENDDALTGANDTHILFKTTGQLGGTQTSLMTLIATGTMDGTKNAVLQLHAQAEDSTGGYVIRMESEDSDVGFLQAEDATEATVFQVTESGAIFSSSTGLFDGNVTALGFIGDLTGNADTATALTGNGANCGAGEIPLGVDASGAVEGCYEPSEADISDLTHYTDADVSTYLTGGTGITESSGTLTFDCSEVEGVGINCATEAITLDATGDWTGELDGYDGSEFAILAEDETVTGEYNFSTGTTTVANLSITTAVSILGEYFTNFTTYVRSLFTGGTHVTITAGSIAVDDDFLLNNGDTGTGTYDMSGATIKQHVYQGFTYASSTALIGAKVIPFGVARTAEIFNSAVCYTDVGTLNVFVSDGTNDTNTLNASTTAGTFTFTGSNTFTAGEKRYVEYNTPATSPTEISCTFDVTVNN